MQGNCICGAITVEAPDHDAISVCHCTTCRRWSGGPMFAVHCGPDVRISGEPRSYQSSDWAERGFCADCGTHLFYKLSLNGDYILPAGLFQDHAFQLESEVFIDHKPAFYALANDTHKLTGEQLFAQFAPPE